MMHLCWRRYLADSLAGFTWTPDNWACKLRTAKGKQRCKWAEECEAWISEHGEAAPGAAGEGDERA